MAIGQALRDIITIHKLTGVTINLQHSAAADNAPFYSQVVLDFHRDARRLHPRYLLIRRFTVGVALCALPETFDEYFMAIEASARRNYKKALRNGYVFQRIAYNDFLEDIGEIRRSATVRQGELPKEFLEGEVKPCTDPPSKTAVHDYPWFGVLKDGKLLAYAGCLVSGELALIEHIYGHADYQRDGIVPMLIIGMAGHMLDHHPTVKQYGYGTYFGAGTTMRRFKRKFRFLPHRVRWELG